MLLFQFKKRAKDSSFIIPGPIILDAIQIFDKHLQQLGKLPW